MLKLVTKCTIGLICFVTFLFVLTAFGATLHWFDEWWERGVSAGIAEYSAYTVFGLGMILLGCMALDHRDAD